VLVVQPQVATLLCNLSTGVPCTTWNYIVGLGHTRLVTVGSWVAAGRPVGGAEVLLTQARQGASPYHPTCHNICCTWCVCSACRIG
jgi:hypothetical protein